MSGNIPRAEYRVLENRQNIYLDAHNKSSANYKNKKGLSMQTNPECSTNLTTVKNICSIKSNVKIYCENKESSRSRSRERKDMCKIRRRNSATAQETCTSTIKVKKGRLSPGSHGVLHRTRSASNYRNKVYIDNKNHMSNKLFQRSCSETRKIPPQYAQCVAEIHSKSKHLISDEVKKRTFTSIEMWKDKMRKPAYTGAVPKNLANKYPNVSNVNKVRTKIMQRKNSESDKVLPKNLNLQSNIDDIKQDKNINSAFSWEIIIKNLPTEVMPILQDNKIFNSQIDINICANRIAENLERNNIFISSTTSTTPLDGPSSLPLTPTKVRYVKRETTRELSTNIEVLDDIQSYEHDYLDDVPYMERQREDNAPKLSSRFLKENVNANQRRIIVGFLIRLGACYEYSSNVIYQTVKLFDVAIDRILVETDNIQLLALTCLWITLKREVIGYKMPSVTTILQLGKELYIDREKDLLIYEKKILLAVKFNLRFADPFSLLCYYILDVARSNKCNIKLNDISFIYFCGCYLLDISMLDEKLCDTSVCVLTVAAAELSFCFVYLEDININMNFIWCQEWRNKFLLTEWEERAMHFTKQTIITHALKSNKFGSNVVYKKYLRNKYCKVSNFVLEKARQTFYSMHKM